MNLSYILSGGSAVAILGAISWTLWGERWRRSRKPSDAQQAGLAVSGRAAKDQRLSSDFILGAIQDGVIMVSQDNSIQLFNPAAGNITGWPTQEAVGLNFNSVLPLLNERGEANPAEVHPFAKALSSQTPIKESNLWLSTKGGKRLPVSLIVSPVLDSSGNTTGSVVGVLRDTTQEKAEEARRSEFISTASHEMRTPIAAIEGYLALTLNQKVAKIDDNARKYLEKASEATKHLGVLFADLLTSSRAEDGRLASYPTVVEVGELIEQVAEAERFHAQEKGLALRYVVNSEDAVVGARVVRPLYYAFVDPHRIREVLQNLVDNAIKYTPEGSITLRLTGDPLTIQVQVQDTGPGIPAEDIPHLFQKFYRVDSSLTRSIGGTGLGLFICRKIVELYNGRIWAESQLSKGSTFFVNLPRLTSEQAIEMQKKQASSVSPLDTR
jgi:two-component system, OmpR family, sensor histidine kinase VicK